jgi:hypothetical protein
MALSVVAALTACGGGGGGPEAPAVTVFPVQQALTYAYTHGLQATLNVTGTATGSGLTLPITGSLTFTQGIATPTTFNNTPAFQASTTINGTLTISGTSQGLNSSSTDYLTSAYAPLGSSSPGDYCVATPPGSYPATASAGQSGNVVTFNCFTDSTMNVATGSSTMSYVTSIGRFYNTLDVKLIQNLFDSSHQPAGFGALTYTITGTGIPSLTGFEMNATASGVTISIVAQ